MIDSLASRNGALELDPFISLAENVLYISSSYFSIYLSPVLCCHVFLHDLFRVDHVPFGFGVLTSRRRARALR